MINDAPLHIYNNRKVSFSTQYSAAQAVNMMGGQIIDNGMLTYMKEGDVRCVL